MSNLTQHIGLEALNLHLMLLFLNVRRSGDSMASKLTQDFERDLSIMTFSGDVTLEDHVSVTELFYEKPTADLIVDSSEIALNPLKYNDLSAFTQMLKEKNELRPKGRTALVVHTEVHFGLARMFESLYTARELSSEIGIFRSMDEAYAWLKSDK